MKRRYILTSAIFILGLTSALAQKAIRVPVSFLKTMQGDWKGKLIYTDYQDDKTQVTMDVWLKSNMTDNRLIKQFYYIEPDGNTKQKAKSQDTTFLSDKGRRLVESGYKHPFDIKHYQISKTAKSSSTTIDGKMTKKGTSASEEQEIVIETTDEDNDKMSLIRVTITTSPTRMTIKKEVKYNGTDSFLLRHTFSYSK